MKFHFWFGSEDMQRRDLGILDIRTADKVEHCETYTCTYVLMYQTNWHKLKNVPIFFFSGNRFAFISFTEQEGAITALQKMKGTKLGDKFLTVTPKTPKAKTPKAKQQEHSSGEKCVGLYR